MGHAPVDIPPLRRELRLLTKVAVVGSRFGVDQTRVAAFMDVLYAREPETVIVSGGAEGADSFAEQAWRAQGGNVISFRPKQLPSGGFTVVKYELSARPTAFDLYLLGHPTWADFAGAAFYRNMLIADEVERCVAFWNGRSEGTRNTMDLCRGRKLPVHQMEV